MAVGARIILGPKRKPQPVISGKPTRAAVTVILAGREHQPREGEFGFLLRIRWRYKTFIFDARQLPERPLQPIDGAQQRQPASCQPQAPHASRISPDYDARAVRISRTS